MDGPVELSHRTVRVGRRLEDRLEAAAPALEAEAARITSVQVLAVMGVGCGLLLSLTAAPGPSFALLAHLPGWPWTAGSVLGGLGVALLVAGRYGYVLSRWLCTAMGAWYFLFALSFALTWVLWAIEEGPQTVHGVPSPNVFQVPVYLGLGALHMTQSAVLRRRTRRHPDTPITPPLGVPVVPAVTRD